MNSSLWPRLAVAHRTDPGRDPAKQENEDACFYQEMPLGHLLVVCDGMGGHASGREASNMAIATIAGQLAQTPPGAAPGDSLKTAIQLANRRVFELGGPPTNVGRPGSTCVSLLIHPMGTDIAHLGDSRAYVVRAGQIWPLTRDHSMVQQMVDAGVLRKEDALSHPDANKITRALGMDGDCNVELRADRLGQQARDLFFLVSDGVTDVVRESDLQALATVAVETANVAGFCEQVVQLANARGGPDNITILAALVLDPGLSPHASTYGPMRSAPQPTVVTSGTTQIPDTVPPEAPPPRAAQSGLTQPGAAPSPASPAPPMPATPVEVARKRPDAGQTVKLAVHDSARKPGAPTIVDDATVSDEAAPAPKRGARAIVGLLLMLVGLVVAGVSLRALLYDDEAPPPLVEADRPPSAAASQPSAPPSR